MSGVENGIVLYAEPDYNPPVCPICGEECEWIFKKDGDVIGCDNCVEQVSSDTWQLNEEENARMLDDDRRYEEAREAFYD